MRLGEICGLMWHDFDEDRGEIMIRRTVHRKDGGGLWTGDTKTSQGRRTIILPPSTVEMLQARQEHSDSKWIFHDPRTYMAETTLNVYSHITDVMQESAAVRIDRGVAGVKPKTLRRSKGVEELRRSHSSPINHQGDVQARVALAKLTKNCGKGAIRRNGSMASEYRATFMHQMKLNARKNLRN